MHGQTTRAGSGVHDHQLLIIAGVRAGDFCHRTGGGFIVCPSDDVRLRGEFAWVGRRAHGGFHDGWGIEPGCTRGGLGKFSGKLAKGEVGGVAFNEPEGGSIPEGSSAAQRKDNLVSLWQGEEIA